ncbi:MAG: sugar phosphate isomerase/epimerase [Ruminococcaceae bacterium]|nr:sugar phosphate isomerase/epimerase [Oscillospiraceae bacterium]
MYKVGLSSSAFSLDEATFKRLAESGIEATELSMPLDAHLSLNHKEVLELSQRYGVKLWSYHLPFFPFKKIDISSLDPELRKNAIELYSTLIAKAADIGIDKFVLHPSGEPIADEDREERIKYSMQNIDFLAELAHRHGARIAVEDLPRSCIGSTVDELARLVSVNDKLRVCFDTNHLLKDDPVDLVKTLGDRIITLHVSDYDFIDERHWLPGEGLNDWSGIYKSLCEVGYNGIWMYEVPLRSKTITRSRDLAFTDFYNNAHAIFEDKTPERIY